MNDLARQLRANEQQLAERLARGDRLDVPRQIDHFLEFRRKSRAISAADELTDLGYVVLIGRRGIKSLIEASRLTAIEPATVVTMVRELIGVADRHGGTYDGWGGSVEK